MGVMMYKVYNTLTNELVTECDEYAEAYEFTRQVTCTNGMKVVGSNWQDNAERLICIDEAGNKSYGTYIIVDNYK
jgi:hypothetical protein